MVGAIAHGHTPSRFALLYPKNAFPGDPNITIETIRRVLLRVEDAEGSLPPILSVTLDNCGSENKNKQLMAYLANLVEMGCFQEVQTIREYPDLIDDQLVRST